MKPEYHDHRAYLLVICRIRGYPLGVYGRCKSLPAAIALARVTNSDVVDNDTGEIYWGGGHDDRDSWEDTLRYQVIQRQR